MLGYRGLKDETTRTWSDKAEVSEEVRYASKGLRVVSSFSENLTGWCTRRKAGTMQKQTSA